MLTPDYLEYCADDIVELYSRLDESIIRDIARRIVKAGNITDTANWQIEKIQQGGYLYDDVIAEIARITGESDSRVKTLFENAGLKSMEFDNAIYKKAGFVIPKDVMSAAAYQVLKAGADKTSGNLRNLTMTTANTSQSAYINACTLAEMQIESGAFDYQTAIRNAVREAAKKGSMVSYPSGHTDRLDVAVRRAVLTGVSQTTGQVALQNARDMGCDLMEITAHSGARPSHQVWQGQLVSLSGRTGYFSLSDIGYGEGSGFKGWNCRHDWFPYFEGVSERAYTNDDLKALEDETVTYNGKSYTEYAATQVQRAMEREIRSTRRELIGLDELIKGGDNGAKAEFENLSVKLKSQEAKLKDFCNKTDRKVDKFRVQVNGFDKSVSQKAVWAEKKAEKYDRLSKHSLDESNQKKYEQKSEEWHSQVKRYSKSSNKKSDKILENNRENGIIIPTEDLQRFKNSFAELGIKNILGFETYTGDVKVLEEMVEDFKKLKQVFPKIFKELSGITYFEQALDEYANFNAITKIINLNKKVYDNTAMLKSFYDNDVLVGHHPKKTTYRANVFHEFGHYVENIAGINPKTLAKRIFKKQNEGYFTRKLGDTWIIQNLSAYASINDYDDYIAECFAEYFNSETPRKIAVDTMKEIFEILSKKGML